MSPILQAGESDQSEDEAAPFWDDQSSDGYELVFLLEELVRLAPLRNGMWNDGCFLHFWQVHHGLPS